mgnify:CR=1 FL=1
MYMFSPAAIPAEYSVAATTAVAPAAAATAVTTEAAAALAATTWGGSPWQAAEAASAMTAEAASVTTVDMAPGKVADTAPDKVANTAFDKAGGAESVNRNGEKNKKAKSRLRRGKGKDEAKTGAEEVSTGEATTAATTSVAANVVKRLSEKEARAVCKLAIEKYDLPHGALDDGTGAALEKSGKIEMIEALRAMKELVGPLAKNFVSHYTQVDREAHGYLDEEEFYQLYVNLMAEAGLIPTEEALAVE